MNDEGPPCSAEDRDRFNRELAAAARAMAEEKDTGHTLERAVRTATDLIGSCDFAGVFARRAHGTETPAASHEALRLVDHLQLELGEGPGVDALRSEFDLLVVNDLAADGRWPNWSARMVDELGIHSCLSYRLFTDGETLGALNLYAKHPHAFTGQDVEDGHTIAAHAAVALHGALEHDQLHDAMRTRRTIGEAIGLLRGRYGLTSDQAFAVLKRLSSHSNVKLAVIAQHVVDNGDVPEPPDTAARR